MNSEIKEIIKSSLYRNERQKESRLWMLSCFLFLEEVYYIGIDKLMGHSAVRILYLL